MTGSYLDPSYYHDNIARGGLEMDFVSAHRPLQAYTEALAEAGFLIERLREPAPPEHDQDAAPPPLAAAAAVPAHAGTQALTS